MDIRELQKNLGDEDDVLSQMESFVEQTDRELDVYTNEDKINGFDKLLVFNTQIKNHLNTIEQKLQNPLSIDSISKCRNVVNEFLELYHKMNLIALRKIEYNKNNKENGTNTKLITLEKEIQKRLSDVEKEVKAGKVKIEKYLEDLKSLSNRMKSADFFNFR